MSYIKAILFYVAGLLALGLLLMHYTGTVADQRELLGREAAERAQLLQSLEEAAEAHQRTLQQLEREKTINEQLLDRGRVEAQRAAARVRQLQETIEGMRRDDQEIKDWGDDPVPAGAVRLWNTTSHGDGDRDGHTHDPAAGGAGDPLPAAANTGPGAHR